MPARLTSSQPTLGVQCSPPPAPVFYPVQGQQLAQKKTRRRTASQVGMAPPMVPQIEPVAHQESDGGRVVESAQSDEDFFGIFGSLSLHEEKPAGPEDNIGFNWEGQTEWGSFPTNSADPFANSIW